MPLLPKTPRMCTGERFSFPTVKRGRLFKALFWPPAASTIVLTEESVNGELNRL